MKLFKYRILNHILFWIVIFSFFTFPRVIAYGFKPEAFVNFLYIPLDIAAVYVVIEYLIPRYIFKNRNYLLFTFLTLLTLAANITLSLLVMYNIQPQLGFMYKKVPIFYEIFPFLVNNLMIMGTASALKLFSYSHKIQLKQSELVRRTTQSELGALRSQVNPHFLFNVLNNIDALIFEDKEKASNAIFLLSKIMRYMLKESKEEKTNLDKELEYIQDYLELAKLSFEDSSFLQFETRGSIDRKQIPPLLFIPIIENSVKHCNKQVKSPGIKISFDIDSGFAELRTSNKVKRNDFKLPDNSTGTGLKNVEKRLKLLYKENYVFDIKQDMETFEVRLKVPLS